MKYVILAILGLIITNGLYVLSKIEKSNREETRRLEKPERINLWR